MKSQALITVYTTVYNTKPYLRQCVESVLNQTYPNLEYCIMDNGSTDGCKEILEEYAASDTRIRLIRREENDRSFLKNMRVALDNAAGMYFTVLDSDDWWEPDFLEKLLAFAEKHNLDVACTGTEMHHMATGNLSFRKVEHEAFFTRETMASGLPRYHVFCRTWWAKLVRMNCLKDFPWESIPALYYGIDTLWCFQCLRRANRMGVNNAVLHHYRIHSKSVSYEYEPGRFGVDVYLYNDAINYLSAFGPVSAQNRQFLQIVYSNALVDTIGVIHGSSLAPEDKLKEYRTIADHPLTRAAYRDCKDESASRSRKNLLCGALLAGAALKKQEDRELRAVMQCLAPRCGQAVSAANAKLFLEDPRLQQALLQDDLEAMLRDLLTRVEKNQFIKKYPLPETIQALAADNPLLSQINDTAFLRKYSQIYRQVWEGEHLAALEEMTGLLLENRVSGGQETFLQLYISLSAVLEQAPAFVFGKLKQAQLRFRQKRLPECRAIIAELEEMGVADNEELDALRRDMEAAEP